MTTKPTYKELEKKVKGLEKEVAKHKKREEVMQIQVNDLGERVKELNCLYDISTFIEESDSSVEEILQGIVNLIPPAWKYPDITCARIIFKGTEFKTENFRETAWKQVSEIRTFGKTIGTLEVYYLEEKAERDEGPFLKEERKLLTIISKRLGRITERKSAEKRIEHLNLVLRAIRNVNQLITKEKDRDRLLKGACDNLTQTRGYYNAWIALLDENMDLVTTAESGLGKDFLPMVDLLKRGRLIDCVQKALGQSEVVVTNNPLSTCTDCPLSTQYSGRGAMTVRFEHEGKIYGIASVSSPIDFLSDEEEQFLFQEGVADIAFALHNIELEEKHKYAEEALQKSEEKYRSLTDDVLDNSAVGIFILDSDFRVVWVNRALEDYFGLKRDDIIGKDKRQLIRERIKDIFENPDSFANKVFTTYDDNTYIERFECHVLPNGTREERWFEHQSRPIQSGLYTGGRTEHYYDITARKQAQEKLTASLKEKEILLKEVHHRAKNNFQIIASLLNLQSQHITDKASLSMFQESQNRIQSMALIHEKLYQSRNLSRIDMNEYMKDLTTSLFRSYGESAAGIKLKTKAIDIFLIITTAIPCGLIINELVTNALKHAFPKERDGTITVSMTPSTKDSIILTVSDTGIGFPEGIDFRNTATLGMQLVTSLVEQLEGTITLDRSEGTRVQIESRKLH